MFFAAPKKLDAALRGSGGNRACYLSCGSVPAMDASGLHAFESAIEKLRRDGSNFLTAVRLSR